MPRAGGSSKAGSRTDRRQPAPKKRWKLLEPELKNHRDPTLLALAGVAAWRSDDSRQLLSTGAASLDIVPSPDIEKLYRQVERETKGDQSNDRLYGMGCYCATKVPRFRSRPRAR